MLNFAILSVVLAVASAAPQGFQQNKPLDPPADVVGATARFIQEYNRLATLAHQAPDIHIIMSDRRIDDPRFNTIQTAPVQQQRPQFFENFSFSAPAQHAPRPRPQTFSAGHLAGHMAGHMAGHTVPAGPIMRWTGPMADTVPAGLNGPPTQVLDTPEVMAAKAAHFSALRAAFAAGGPQRV